MKDDATKRPPRKRGTAILLALVPSFGAGHFYAGRKTAGAILLALELACLALGTTAPLFVYAIAGIALADAIGAARLVGADLRGTKPRFGEVPGPALAALAIAVVPAMLGIAPGVLAGSDAVRACELADRCGSRESLARCIDRAADRTFYGRRSIEGDRTCAACLERAACGPAASDCTCEARVSLIPTEDTSDGPMGTRPDDLQHVVPSLFGDPRAEGHAPSDAELEDLLRTLDELPPPTEAPATPSSPARP